MGKIRGRGESCVRSGYTVAQNLPEAALSILQRESRLSTWFQGQYAGSGVGDLHYSLRYFSASNKVVFALKVFIIRVLEYGEY